jgi:pSer/pThr/pTyr-binding forkhead associated (FHA) protein
MHLPDSNAGPPMTLSLPQAFGLACKATGPLTIRTTHRATRARHEHVLHTPFAFLGRSAAAGIRLDDPSVSQGHAYLQIIEGVPFCIDLGSRTGVVWDDGSQGQGWVLPDHTLQIGAFDIRVEATPGSSDPSSDPNDPNDDPQPILTPATVELHTSSSTSHTLHQLDRAITLVGRHPSCDLRLLDVTIGYFQCALVNTSDGVWLVDTMSRKGAILNGRGTRLARVRDGDLLELGRMSLVMRIGAHYGAQLALRTPSPAVPDIDAIATISTAVSESLAGAIVPIGEMMKQFQQGFMAMAQMFTTMQQEHATLVGAQMRQIQELASELRDLRAEVRHTSPPPAVVSPPPAPPAPAPAPESPPPQPTPAPRAPTLKAPTGAEGQTLSDAHAWFMERLAKGQASSAG